MVHKSVKTVAVYALILALGLGAGHALPRVWQMVTPKYSTGDFKAFYPDAKTQVVVYGTDTCPYCIQARDYLKGRKVAFGDFNVKDGGKGQRDYAALGAKVVPVILIGNRRLEGFNEKAVADALEALPAM